MHHQEMEFADVELLIKNQIEFSLIDVRTEEERFNPGRIPGSANVPFSELIVAFNSSEKDFAAEYDFRKPPLDAEKLTVHCYDGTLAKRAAVILREFGYLDIRVYEGGFKDWSARGGKTIRGYGHEIVDYDQVQKGIRDKSMILVDTRNHDEREDPGRIPNDYVLPLPEFWPSFINLNDKDFSDKYGFSKPIPSTKNFVLYCRSGKRARDAADKLFLIDYKNISIYKGSFQDWEKKGGGFIRGFQSLPKIVIVGKNGNRSQIDLKEDCLEGTELRENGGRREIILCGENEEEVEKSANLMALEGHIVNVCKNN